jgi:uncharacterized protein (DUF488 family)
MTLPTIYTLGHSTRSLEELIGLLGAVEVRELVDVRSAPRSRRHPHLAAGALGRALPTHGIAYRHEQALSGHRHPRQQSPNQAWRERAFGGYADYMNTDGFRAALDHLQARATRQTTCLLCAEVDWRRCHRRLICDALLVPRLVRTTPWIAGEAVIPRIHTVRGYQRRSRDHISSAVSRA